MHLCLAVFDSVLWPYRALIEGGDKASAIGVNNAALNA